jgi:cytochrome c-type biogenesis protein CcmH
MKWFKLFSIFLFVLYSISYAFSASEILTFDSDELRERYAQLTFQLRCPKCQNQNVADSNAPISLDIRQKTYEMLHQGYSDQEIIDFMVQRYTEFVIYKPQFSMVTIWLWIVPLSILLVGGLILVKLTRSSGSEAEPDLSNEESTCLKALLEGKS